MPENEQFVVAAIFSRRVVAEAAGRMTVSPAPAPCIATESFAAKSIGARRAYCPAAIWIVSLAPAASTADWMFVKAVSQLRPSEPSPVGETWMSEAKTEDTMPAKTIIIFLFIFLSPVYPVSFFNGKSGILHGCQLPFHRVFPVNPGIGRSSGSSPPTGNASRPEVSCNNTLPFQPKFFM